MIIVTGGAGFIGSNIVRGLNKRGLNNILVVDDLSDGNKVRNIEDCDIEDYMDKTNFYVELKRVWSSVVQPLCIIKVRVPTPWKLTVGISCRPIMSIQNRFITIAVNTAFLIFMRLRHLCTAVEKRLRKILSTSKL